MVFREDLEGGTLCKGAIDSKVGEYRAKLIAEAEAEATSAAALEAAARTAALARCAGLVTASGASFEVHLIGKRGVIALHNVQVLSAAHVHDTKRWTLDWRSTCVGIGGGGC